MLSDVWLMLNRLLLSLFSYFSERFPTFFFKTKTNRRRSKERLLCVYVCMCGCECVYGGLGGCRKSFQPHALIYFI